MPTLIPRNRDRLPRELIQRGSDLDQMITLAGDAAASNSFGAQGTLKAARSMIKRLCPKYRPSRASSIETVCGSGEDDGQPFRSGCGVCLCGQFTAAGMYLGDVIPMSALTRASQ